mgnify:CR=1 FL=1
MNNRKNNFYLQKGHRVIHEPVPYFGGKEATTPVSKMIGASGQQHLEGFLGFHKDHITSANFKRILSQLSQRSAIQSGATGFCIFLVFAYFLAMLVLGGIYYRDAGNTVGVMPLAFVAAVPMGFMGVALSLGGVSFWTDEPDTNIGASLGVLFAFICFATFSGIVYHITTPVNWSSCPSMDPPGTGIMKEFTQFYVQNYTVCTSLTDPFNKANLPGCYKWDQWLDLFRNTVNEIVCYNNMLFQFFWWCTMVFYFVGALLVATVGLNWYRRRQELAQAWDFIRAKVPITNIAGKEYVTLNNEPDSEATAQIMEETVQQQQQPDMNMFPTSNTNYPNYYNR